MVASAGAGRWIPLKGIRYAAVLAAAGAQLAGGPAAAQQVSGRVLDEATGAPVQGAFVTLLAGGRAVARALADERGQFRLRAPEPGSYTVSVERIGYGTYRSPGLMLAADDSVHRELRLPARPVALDALGVETARRCAGATAETALLWEEARKALSVAAWVSESSLVRYEIRVFERTLDPAGRRTLSEQARSEEFLYDRSPFRTWPIEDLLERGFVQRVPEDASWRSWGPGADGLLSDAFLSAHCFRATTSREEPGLVGLAFEPVARPRTTGIAGSLWLDRTTYELRRVDFHFVNPPWDVPPPASGGRIEYERLPSGIWIISSWAIRTPIMNGRRLRAIFEEGRQVTGVWLPDGRRMR